MVSGEILLDKTELGILVVLNSEGNELRPGEIAMELDCSHELVGRRAKTLAERHLLDRPYQGAQRVYSLKDLAKQAYFSKDGSEDLDVSGRAPGIPPSTE